MMILLAKLTLGLMWLLAFLITCIVMGLLLPFVIIFEGIQTLMNGASVS